jgi:hypothetical protein
MAVTIDMEAVSVYPNPIFVPFTRYAETVMIPNVATHTLPCVIIQVMSYLITDRSSSRSHYFYSFLKVNSGGQTDNATIEKYC